MCVKVIDDVKASYAKLVEASPKGKKQDVAEKALLKHCSQKTLSTKDHKLVRRRLLIGVALARSTDEVVTLSGRAVLLAGAAEGGRGSPGDVQQGLAEDLQVAREEEPGLLLHALPCVLLLLLTGV